MRDVKKILEMRSQNFSHRKIAEALKVSGDTVRKVSKAADENNICWSMIQNQNEMEVHKLLFGKETKHNLIIKKPDYQYIYKELLRPGQTSDYYGRNMQKTVEIVNSHSISTVTSVKSLVIM